MIAAVAAGSLFMNGCKKDSNSNPTTDELQLSAEKVGQDESATNEIDNMTSQATRTGSFTPGSCPNPDMDFYSLRSCATVTRDSVLHTVTYDFGTGCTGRDGKVRSGRVIVTYTGTGYFDPGSSWVVTFDNYYVNNRHLEGTRSVTNNGLNTAGNMTWSIQATNMRVTRPDGSWRSWDSQRTREMIAGYGDSLWTNDIYKVNGTASGTNSAGETFTSVITDLIRDHSCRWITSGTIVNTPSNRPAMTIDFGNGNCDDEATVTRNGNTRTIHLRF